MKRFFVIIAIFLLTLVVVSQASAQGRGRGDERRITTPSGEFGRDATRGAGRRISENEGKKTAVVGTVTSIDSATGSFTLSTKKGIKTVQTSAATVFKEKGATISFSDLSVSDFVGVTGQQTAQDTITANRVMRVPKEDNPLLKRLKRHAVYGVVGSKEASAGGTLLKLSHPKRGTLFEVLVTSETKITKKGMEGTTTIDDIKVNDRVTAVGTRNDAGLLLAKRLHVIPGLARGLFGTQPTSTPAATPTLPPVTNTPVPPTETPTP